MSGKMAVGGQKSCTKTGLCLCYGSLDESNIFFTKIIHVLRGIHFENVIRLYYHKCWQWIQANYF